MRPRVAKSIKQRPGGIQSDDVTVIERRAHIGIAFAVDLVTGKEFDLRTSCAAIDLQLFFLDCDILFGRFDLGPIEKGAGERDVEIRVARFVLERANGFELPVGGSAAIDAAEVVQAQIGVAQIGLRLNQLGLFIGQRDLRATGIQRPDQARTQAFALAFQFFPQDGDRFFADVNFFPVQEQLVKGEPHVHRDAVCHRLEFVQLFGQDEASDRNLIAGRAASVNIFHHLERCIVILRTELRRLRDCTSAIESSGNNGGKITGVRFELAAPRGLDFLPGDRDFRILRPAPA